MHKTTTLSLHTGNTIPVIRLGTWQLTPNTSQTIIKALGMGYPMIDTSGDYSTQPGIGQGIKQSGVSRDNFYLVTKVEETNNAYDATLKNLKELDLEYVDLMLIHRPPPTGFGAELWEGLIKAKKEGLVKDIGVSNYSIAQIESLAHASGEMPTVNQIEWSPFGYSPEMLKFAQKHNLIIQAYSPLTRGQQLNHPKLNQIAAQHQRIPAQILLRWNIQLGTVPLPKANSINHLQQNLNIFDFELSEAEMQALQELNTESSSLGSKLQYV